MKKLLSMLLAAVLLVSLSAALGTVAYANDGDDGYTVEVKGTEGSLCSWCINEKSGMSVVRVLDVVWGSYPPGLTIIAQNDGSLMLVGTPTQAGYWRVTQCVEARNPQVMGGKTWEESYDIRITIESAGQAPVITKHPAGETVAELGWTEFIAYANDAKYIRWQLVNQANGQIINAADAPTFFPGIKVTGADSTTLVFENVPLSLDNWAARCVFSNDIGEVTTSSAPIRVVKTELKAPVINTQPVALELEYGAKGTLSFEATSPDGNLLTYQWYKNSEPSRNGGDAIYGAYGTSLTVDYEYGTFYYYCVIRNTKGNESASPVATELVAVTGKGAPAPAPTEAPVETPAPTEAPVETPAPTEAPAPAPAEAPAKNNTAVIILAVVCAAEAVALIAVLLKKK